MYLPCAHTRKHRCVHWIKGFLWKLSGGLRQWPVNRWSYSGVWCFCYALELHNERDRGEVLAIISVTRTTCEATMRLSVTFYYSPWHIMAGDPVISVSVRRSVCNHYVSAAEPFLFFQLHNYVGQVGQRCLLVVCLPWENISRLRVTVRATKKHCPLPHTVQKWSQNIPDHGALPPCAGGVSLSCQS